MNMLGVQWVLLVSNFGLVVCLEDLDQTKMQQNIHNYDYNYTVYKSCIYIYN